MTAIIQLSHQAALLVPMSLQVLAGATAIMLVASGAVLLLKHRSAAVRHRVWALSATSLLALPLLTLLLPNLGPAWQLRIPLSAAIADSAPTTVAGVSAPGLNDTPVPPRPDDLRQHDAFPSVELPSAPQRDISVQSAPGGDASPATSAATRPSATFNTWGGVVGVWLTGVVIGLVLFMRRRWSVTGIVRRAVPITDSRMGALVATARKSAGVRGAVRLLCSPEITVPVAVGSFRPLILLPAGYGQWSEGRCRVVLSHELAHACRHDVFWQTVAQLACHAYWFHPLVWLANYRMRVEREFACDDAVLEIGEPPRQYASHLVALASTLRHGAKLPESAVAIAGSGSLEQRVGAILELSRSRTPVGQAMSRLLAAGALAMVVTLSLITPSTSQNVGDGSESANAPAGDTANQPAAGPGSAPRAAASVENGPQATTVAEDPPQDKAKQPAAASNPLWTPAVGKGFVIVPFLTDLQRNYSWGQLDAALYLLINGTDLCSNDDTTLNMSAVDFGRIEAAMVAYHRNGLDLTEKSIVIQVIGGPNRGAKDGPTTGAAEILYSYLRQRHWTKKNNLVRMQSRDPDHPLNWDQLVATLAKVPTADEVLREAGVGDKLVKVYPICTPLSRYLIGEPENCVLRNLKPCDEMTPDEVAAFPELVKEYLAKLELGKPAVINFVEDFGNSTSKGNRVARKLSDGLQKHSVKLWGHTLWAADRQYTVPFLFIKLVDADNRAIENATISATYDPEVQDAPVPFEREKDGRWNSHGLTGYEDFTLTIEAPGYKTHSEKLNLPWSSTKNLDVTLQKK